MSSDKDKEVDIYRDTPVRLLGYANEVGEAFRSLVPKGVVIGSYLLSSAYVLADTQDKTRKMHKELVACGSKRVFQSCAVTAADTVLWQALASVIVPGFTINRVCYFSAIALRKYSKMGGSRVNWTTTLLGLGTIPFIVHPIDTAVEQAMNHTIKKLY